LAAGVSVCPGEGPRYGDYRCNHDHTHRVCAELKDNRGAKVSWGGTDFWTLTHQSDWSSQVGSDSDNPGGDWCICMWATASLIQQVGCENVHIDCEATDVSYVMQSYTDGGTDLAPAKACLQQKCITTTIASNISLGGVSSAQFTIAAQLTFRKAVASGAGASVDDVTVTTYARRSMSVQLEVLGGTVTTSEFEKFMQSTASDGFLAVLVNMSKADGTISFANAVTTVQVASITSDTPMYSSGSGSNGVVIGVVVALCLVTVGAAAIVLCCCLRSTSPSSPRSYHDLPEGKASKLSLETRDGSGSGASSGMSVVVAAV